MGIEHKVKARQALSEFYLTRDSNRMYVYITNTNQILHIISQFYLTRDSNRVCVYITNYNQILHIISQFYLTRDSNRVCVYITNYNPILHIIPGWIIIWIYFNNSFTTFLLTILLAQNFLSFWFF